MANGWGGARRGAGRPKNGEPAANDNPEKLRMTAEGKPIKAVSFEALAALVEASRERARTRPRTTDWCPYKIAQHPPSATPKKELTMAMDDALVSNNAWAEQAWMAGGMLSSASSEGLLFMGYPFLSELAQRPEFRVISETIATELTRKWIRFKAKGDADKSEKISELTDFLDDLKLRDRMCDAALHDGQFGRSHLFLDPGNVSDDEMKTPLGTGRDKFTGGKLNKGWLKDLRVIEPMWVYPTTYNAQNPLSADWYKPQVWYVMGKEIHRSRLPTIVGRPVPDLLKPAYSFGGLSLSQMAKPYVDIWLQTRESVAEIVRSFSVMVLETDLATRLMPGGGGAGDVLARVAAFNALRDNQGTFVINKATEGFQNVSAPLSGLHELQAQSQEHMASVARIPLVKFTGISPAGLNASSDGEMRAFNDTIAATQPKLLGPTLDFVIDVAMITLWGERDPDIVHEWVPLHALTELEEADLDKKQAETAQIRIDSGVISQEEERTVLAGDPKTRYPGLDPNDVPDLKEEEEAGLVPPGAGKGLEAVLDKPGEGERGGEDAVIPFVEGADEAPFEEGKHPRDNAGKFAKTAGGGGKGGEVAKHDPVSKSPPLNTAKMKNVGPQMGSNPGGVYADEGGKTFYIKQVKTQERANNEVLAAKLYALTGSPTLTYHKVVQPGRVATEMADLGKKNVKDFTPEERKQARADFVTHAWLANWDAAGTGGDNLGTIAHGGGWKVAPLDFGGALEYRAQGEPKGDAFGDKVYELTTMLDEKTSPDNAKLYGDMTGEELKASAQKVVNIPDDEIKAAVESMGGGAALADKLIARKNDIAQFFNLEFESKHARGPGGKFAKMAGVEEPGGKPKKSAFGGLWKEGGDNPAANFHLNAAHVLSKPANAGQSFRQMLAFMIKEAPIHGHGSMVPGLQAKFAEALYKAGAKAVAAGDTDGANKVNDAVSKLEKGAPDAVKAGWSAYQATGGGAVTVPPPKGEVPAPEPAKPAPAAKKSPAPPPVPAAGKATAAELKKAEKPQKLQVQYVPGAPQTPEAQKLVDAFNQKWEGKTGLSQEELEHKVEHFKGLQAAMVHLAAAHAEEQAAQAKAEAAKIAKEMNDPEVAEHYEVLKGIGLNKNAWQAAANVIKAKKLSITPQQGAYIQAYVGNHYKPLNKQFRKGVLTAEQYKYGVKLDEALDGMPVYKGDVVRGADLEPHQWQKYVEAVGHVIPEPGFQSAGAVKKLWGEYTFNIKSRTGRDIRAFNPGEGGGEILFKNNTPFKVIKVQGKTCWMEELEV